MVELDYNRTDSDAVFITGDALIAAAFTTRYLGDVGLHLHRVIINPFRAGGICPKLKTKRRSASSASPHRHHCGDLPSSQ